MLAIREALGDIWLRFSAALSEAPSRREILLFGLLMLEIGWITMGQKPRTVVVFRDTVRMNGMIT
jgi:hypothetical protein